MDIRTDALRRYVATRQEVDAANATIRKELAALQRAFNLAVQADRLTTRPHFPSVKVNNTREGSLTMADVDAICAEIRSYLVPVVRFAALTGWRKSEVVSLP